MVFATLVQYFCDIPATDAVMFLGVPISGKIFTYSIALQVGSQELYCAGPENVHSLPPPPPPSATEGIRNSRGWGGGSKGKKFKESMKVN